MKAQIDFVESVTDGKLAIQCASESHMASLAQLGGQQRVLRPQSWTFDYKSDDELAGLLNRLRDLGFAMAGGSSGWPPAAVFESLREDGKIQGGFKEVLWKGASDVVLVER